MNTGKDQNQNPQQPQPMTPPKERRDETKKVVTYQPESGQPGTTRE